MKVFKLILKFKEGSIEYSAAHKCIIINTIILKNYCIKY